MSKVNAGQASSTLIPKYIGSDFDKVVAVADNIEQVVVVSNNTEDVGIVADNINYVKEVAEDLHGMPVTMYTGENPPVLNPMPEGVMWYCTTDGRTYVWYTDADSGQWVESAPQSAMKDEATNIFFHSTPSNVNPAYRNATLFSTPTPEAEISVAHNTLNTPVLQAQFIREEALWVDVSVTGAQGIVTLMGYSSGNSQLKAEIITWKNGAEGTSLGTSQWVTLPSQPSVVSLPVTLANIDVLDAGDSYVVKLTSQMNAGGSAVSTILVDGNTSSRFGIIFNTNLIGLNDGIRDGVTTSAPTENAVYDALQLKVGKSQLVQSGNLTSTANWANVPAYSDSGLGGSGGPLNAQAKALTARSELLLTDVREALRRSYAEAGYNLVDGSFEAGGTLVNANDVLLQERTGKAFSGPAGTVAAGTNPASGGFVDRSLRNWVQGGVSSPYQTYIYRHPNTPTLSVYSVAPQPMGAAPDFSIFTQIGSIEVDTFVQLQALSVPDGVKIKMNGYYNKGDVDQHPGFTVVADTTLYKDNFGAVVQLASGNYAVINSRSEVRATWMGVRTDPSYDNRERLVALGRATRNASALLDIRGAIHTSPVEYAYNSNLRGMESRGTQIKIYPLFPTPTQETYLFSDEYNPNAQTRDNNFFVIRSTFSIRPERRKNIGAYHFKAGGGSRLESLYIVDGGEGAATLLMSGTGASPSVTVESCWIGVTVRDGVSHNRNGVEIVSSYSVIFNQCTFDYLSDDRRMVNGVAVDNGNNDLTGGFAVYIRSCEGLTFQSANGEGNKKPFRIGNSVTVTISGGAFYRRSLNYSPSDEPDFFITLDDNSAITAPHIEKSMISGYKESTGGGVMRTINGGVLPVARQNEVYVGLYSPGQSAFQNVRTLQMVGKGSSVQAGVIGRLTQTFSKMVLSENVPPNTDASFDSKLNGAGMLIVTYQRISDNAFYGETQTYAYVGHNDSGVLTQLAGASTNASYTALNVSTFDSSNRRFIRVSVASKPWSASVSVFFIGCEYLL